MYRSAIVRQARFLSTSSRLQKGPVETAKDALKAVDRTVSQAAVKGIETAEDVTGKVKESVPSQGEAKGKAEELSGQASGKAQELSGQASGKAAELKGEAKGTAEEIKGKMS